MEESTSREKLLVLRLHLDKQTSLKRIERDSLKSLLGARSELKPEATLDPTPTTGEILILKDQLLEIDQINQTQIKVLMPERHGLLRDQNRLLKITPTIKGLECLCTRDQRRGRRHSKLGRIARIEIQAWTGSMVRLPQQGRHLSTETL